MGQFNDLKITEQEFLDHGMTSLPGTKWTNQAEMLKRKLDEEGTFVGERMNEVLDLLEGGEAAGNIGVTPFGPYASDTVQGLIEETTGDLQGKIDDITAGVLPNDSITTEKIRNGAVTVAKLGGDITPGAIGAASAEDTFTKEECLAPTTAALYGGVETVDEALNLLGKIGTKKVYYTTPGTFTFVAPKAGNYVVEMVGGGTIRSGILYGAGYASKTVFLERGEVTTVVVGAVSAPDADGDASSFGSHVSAEGGRKHATGVAPPNGIGGDINIPGASGGGSGAFANSWLSRGTLGFGSSCYNDKTLAKPGCVIITYLTLGEG